MTASAHGRKVVITRSKAGNLELAGRLDKMGFIPISVDSMEFLPPSEWSAIDERLANLAQYDWLVFTSSTGVRSFLARMREIGFTINWGGRPLVGAVGGKTAQSLMGAGLYVSFIPSEYLTSRLGEELPADMGKRILLLRASVGGRDLTKALSARGFAVDELAIYSTRHVPDGFNLQQHLPVDLIIFGSPSAVTGFCGRIPPNELAQIRHATAACIGPVTERAARLAGFKNVLVPEEHTYNALLEMIGRSA